MPAQRPVPFVLGEEWEPLGAEAPSEGSDLTKSLFKTGILGVLGGSVS